ncbi:hypothetical protein [Dictyobacter aurantiacus]|uniref:Uncharacterized protein n=1 Tax=Dictyobacter aurantiacus TaxID=1936993 RepID=A0A401ZI75_9CHLR|nr:hypothetical protein [Dictyobacter aurantiacus]GCE06545.1 hypothetical protein KDAU_38740 [Dictyobacter aurantiacus]
MSVPPQPPLGEEPEKKTELQSGDQISEQPAPTPETVSHEDATEQPTTTSDVASPVEGNDSPTIPSETASHEEATEQPTIHDSADEETTPQPMTFSEPPADSTESSEDTVVDNQESLEEEDLEEDDETAQPARSGIFIKKGVLIGVISAVVLVALLAALLFFVNRPKDPPTDWLSSVTPPAGSGSATKILYYLHWSNDNGELKGQLQLAAYANGAPQSLTAPASGLYSRDNHDIYVVVTINGQATTLSGKINDSNDTLTLNQVGAPNQASQLVFHTSSADAYKQETRKLVPAKK